jgi:acyl-CoA dehydrogenase
MNFEFSQEALDIGEEVRRTLTRHDALAGARCVLDGKGQYDEALWRLIGELGWSAACLPEEYGGSGLSGEVLCMLAYELGRANAAVPFASSVYFASLALMLHGSAHQRARWLPALGSGECIGTFACALGFASTDPFAMPGGAKVVAGRLTGERWPVADGGYASIAIVLANDEHGSSGLYAVALDQPGVQRERLQTIDPTRDYARLRFDQAQAERLGDAPFTRDDLRSLWNRASVPLAFEALGGAQACLDMSVDYAKLRYAFGRPIGSFQAIKHKLANLYIAVELARSNAYYAAWALASDASRLALAVASAQLAATDAFYQCAKETIQVHGGFGVTWEANCHLYLRRARALSAAGGSSSFWKEQIVCALEARPDFVME